MFWRTVSQTAITPRTAANSSTGDMPSRVVSDSRNDMLHIRKD